MAKRSNEEYSLPDRLRKKPTNQKKKEMIDFSKKYSIEPRLRIGDPQGLDKEGISSHVGTSKFLFAKFNQGTGKFVTGLDIYAPEILSIADEKERKRQQDIILETKSKIEAFFGKPGLLDASPKRMDNGELAPCFWDEFGVSLVTGANKESYIELDGKQVQLNPSMNPKHMLALIMLEANGYLPKSRKESASPQYKDAKFLLTTQDEVDSDHKTLVRREILKGKYLAELFGDSVNYERAWEIAYYIGLKPKLNMSEDSLQASLYMATKDKDTLTKFLKACTLKNEEILVANTFKKGVEMGLIYFDPTYNMYIFGATNLKKTEEESINYLKTPGMALPLAQLKEAIDSKKKKGKNKV